MSVHVAYISSFDAIGQAATYGRILFVKSDLAVATAAGQNEFTALNKSLPEDQKANRLWVDSFDQDLSGLVYVVVQSTWAANDGYFDEYIEPVGVFADLDQAIEYAKAQETEDWEDMYEAFMIQAEVQAWYVDGQFVGTVYDTANEEEEA